MKIGQITMYGDNYGACLQAFALQKVIQNMGHDIEIIRYLQTNRNIVGSASKLKKIQSLGVSGLLKYVIEHKYIELRKNAYKNFRERFLSFNNKEWFRDDDLADINDKYDCFICGSDMIWSEEFSKDWDFFFLKFADKRKSYSYAPSFGKNSLEDENRTRVKNYLEQFARVSCRENGGVELIGSLGIQNAIQVLDPTMLLSKDEWCELIPEKERVIREPYVFAYLFGNETDGRKSFINTVENKIGKVYTLPKFTKKSQNSFPINGIGPMDYLRLFRDAEFIVTDTFHGLMFSIIFRKPFVVLQRHDGSQWSKYSDRMTSTLEMFGLADRYIDDNFKQIEIFKELDYSKYEEIIDKRKEDSLTYISEILKEAENG